MSSSNSFAASTRVSLYAPLPKTSARSPSVITAKCWCFLAAAVLAQFRMSRFSTVVGLARTNRPSAPIKLLRHRIFVAHGRDSTVRGHGERAPWCGGGMPMRWWIGSFSNKNPPKPAQNNAFLEIFRHKKRASWASIGDSSRQTSCNRRPQSWRKWLCVEISKIPAPPLTKGAKTAKSPHSAPFWHLSQVLSVGGQNIFIFSKPSRFH